MIIEVDIPWPLFVPGGELFIVRWAFILGIACQHTLYAHADTLDVLHRTPPLIAQKIKAYDTIRVNVWVYRNWSTRAVLLQERYLWGFDRILVAKLELQAKDLVEVERVLIKDFDVKHPLFEVLSLHEGDAWRQAVLDLSEFLAKPFPTQTCGHRMFPCGRSGSNLLQRRCAYAVFRQEKTAW